MVYKSTGLPWTMLVRDLTWSRNIFVFKGVDGSLAERKKFQSQAMTAFIMYTALKLLRNTNDARDLSD